VSHSANGVYGELFSAVLVSLAFYYENPRPLLHEASAYLPRFSEYAAVVDGCLDFFTKTDDPLQAWHTLDRRFEQYNWIHAYPNIAAVVLALWYGEGGMTRSFSLLAQAGLDVDCNGGLVGNILGVMNGVPTQWSEPLGDLLETYLPSKPRLSISQLAARTVQLAHLENK
jgi:hypothetical protein